MSFLLRRKLAGALLFIVPRHDYWHPHLPPKLTGPVGGSDSYYLDFSAKCPHPGPFDDEGVPFTRYGGGVGLQHYPIDICQYALGHHEQWLATRETRHLDIFLTQAHWLRRKLHLRPSRPGAPAAGLWLAEFDWGCLRSPWPSAMAQGQGISVMTRAHAVSGDSSFLATAQTALAGLRLTIEEGGTTRYDGALPFFEETPVAEPSRILNGAIFALWGVHDLCLVTQDPAIRLFHDDALQNLLHFLPQYDIGFWTRYDLEPSARPHVSSAFYHELHAYQLRVMHRLTGLEPFKKYALRWELQFEILPYRCRALLAKVLN